MSDSEELERAKRHLMKLQNAANLPLLSTAIESEHVRILIDEKISPAMFKPHASLVNTYYANSLTVRAVKKDLFLGGEGFQDLEKLTPCTRCNREIDTQFWKFCPYCEGKLSK
jgi:hypothetical protein